MARDSHSREIKLSPRQTVAVLLTRDGFPLSLAQQQALGRVSAEVDHKNLPWKQVFELADENAANFGRAVLDYYLEE